MQSICRYSRDNARVPYPWDDSPNGGFCDAGVRPWLCVHPDYPSVNLRAEENDPDSVLAFYKEMIRLRKAGPYSSTIVDGRFDPILRRCGKLVAYTRRGEKNLAVICSLSDRARTLRLPFVPKKVIQSSQRAPKPDGNVLRLRPYQSVLLEF